MKVLVFIFLVVAGASANDKHPFALYRNYHEDIGIPLAAKIKAIEESKDFDGGNAPGRIWNGNPSGLGDNPHLAGLLVIMGNGAISVCSGSVLNNRHVLTSARCCTAVWKFEVVLGSTTLFYGGTRVETTDFVQHKDYDSLSFKNDLAVIKFKAVTLNKNIAKVTMPTGTMLTDDFIGWRVFAAGFGVNGNVPLTENQVQTQADLQVVTNSVCFNAYGSTNTDTLCCATTYSSSTCSGDTGGPLIVLKGSNRVLIGVFSNSHREGCDLGHPLSYTRVASYVKWIKDNSK